MKKNDINKKRDYIINDFLEVTNKNLAAFNAKNYNELTEKLNDYDYIRCIPDRIKANESNILKYKENLLFLKNLFIGFEVDNNYTSLQFAIWGYMLSIIAIIYSFIHPQLKEQFSLIIKSSIILAITAILLALISFVLIFAQKKTTNLLNIKSHLIYIYEKIISNYEDS